MIVKVATFRNSIDHLFRVVNVDYHACVGAAELRNWQGIAGRVLAEVEGLECKRANQDDREQQRRSIEAARERLARGQERIAQLEAVARPAVGGLQ
nr:hypothetical protein [uncultured bacterium]